MLGHLLITIILRTSSNYIVPSNIRRLALTLYSKHIYLFFPIARVAVSIRRDPNYIWYGETKKWPQVPLSTNSVNFVNKDNGGRQFVSHPKQFSHQLRSITQILLYQLTSYNAKKCCRCRICNSLCSNSSKSIVTKHAHKNWRGPKG